MGGHHMHAERARVNASTYDVREDASTCVEGYKGVMCSVCIDGYYESAGRTCTRCGDTLFFQVSKEGK